MAETHSVFASHRHEDDEKIDAFKELMKGHDVTIRDSSVTSANPNQAKDPNYIKSILAERIRQSGKMVVLITDQTRNHPWVDWEINYAARLDKPIIGVWAHGHAQCELPDALESHHDALVPWNADKIMDALNGNYEHLLPDGTLRPLQPISRISC